MSKTKWANSEVYLEHFSKLKASDFSFEKFQEIKDLNIHPLEKKWLIERLYVLRYEHLYNKYTSNKSINFNTFEQYHLQDFIDVGFTLNITKIREKINIFVNS